MHDITNDDQTQPDVCAADMADATTPKTPINDNYGLILEEY